MSSASSSLSSAYPPMSVTAPKNPFAKSSRSNRGIAAAATATAASKKKMTSTTTTTTTSNNSIFGAVAGGVAHSTITTTIASTSSPFAPVNYTTTTTISFPATKPGTSSIFGFTATTVASQQEPSNLAMQEADVKLLLSQSNSTESNIIIGLM